MTEADKMLDRDKYTKMTPLQKRIEREYDMPLAEVIRKLYVDEHLSVKQMGDKLDVSTRTAHRWLRECGIQARKMNWS